MVSPLLGRFLVSFNLQSAICGLQSAVCGLQSVVCGLQSAVCSLQSANVIHRTTSGFPFEQQQQQPELINEAGSSCSSDSVEEENEIDEQLGRTIQRQIPQSQRGKRRQYLLKII